jgi:hypothetical protein
MRAEDSDSKECLILRSVAELLTFHDHVRLLAPERLAVRTKASSGGGAALSWNQCCSSARRSDNLSAIERFDNGRFEVSAARSGIEWTWVRLNQSCC